MTVFCRFFYRFTENLQCDTPSVNNGQLECDGNGRVTCSLKCNSGYNSSLTDEIESTCTAEGEWNPPFDPNLQQIGCAGTK